MNKNIIRCICSSIGSKRCNDGLCSKCCDNTNCISHGSKIRKKLKKISKDNKCKCGNIFSSSCSNKLCKKCCINTSCVFHKFNNKEDSYDSNEDKKKLCCDDVQDIEKYKEILKKIININDLRDIVMEYIDERVRCSICKIYLEYDGLYIIQCTKCKIFFCENCTEFHETNNYCSEINCYHCMNGWCFNTYKTGDYCNNCYDPKIHGSDDDFSIGDYPNAMINDIICECGNMAAERCSSLSCKICCNDVYCTRHKKSFVNYISETNESDYSEEDEPEENNIFDYSKESDTEESECYEINTQNNDILNYSKEDDDQEILNNNVKCDVCNKYDDEIFKCVYCEKSFHYDCVLYQDEYKQCDNKDCMLCDPKNGWYCVFVGRCCINCFS